MYSLKNKNIIVTGSEGLIGKSIVKNLIRNKAKVFLIDIKKTNNDKIKNYYYCDLTNKDLVSQLSKKIIKKAKYINGLINCASVQDKIEDKKNFLNSKFENLSIESWDHMIKGNLNSLFICSQVFGKYLIKKKNSFIINFSSTYGMVAPDNSIYKNKFNKQIFYKNPAYPASKGAVISFTKYLAAYWGNKGLRVNCISPGGVKNNQDKLFIKKYSEKTILKRMANVDDISNTVNFLASDDSNYITGANIVVDGGWTSI
ncbi:SDR family oxidoreductase [Candidatus Pelagibacter sp. RS39]|uniref:SDR family oxidoreductase n=1 Tax=Candidatus Pelagibacter sp. RS39 TaxID=1977864 RepID=UPI000A147AF4|nr:SDR family oxidoreductase [Candidatus Pelagibacter sp. RS39]ARJ47478.1 hypothetical protein B5L73_01425 [Candidatus Pelagibacter sp. RS39]